MSVALAVGKSGFLRERTSWLTNHADLTEALKKWRERVSGIELDGHAHLKNVSASARYPIKWVDYFLQVIREDF